MGNWIAVRLEQPARTATRSARGSRSASATTDEREVTIGGGHASGELGWIHFGLGDADSAEVRVQWPDGEVGPWMDVAANGFVTIPRGAPTQTWTPAEGDDPMTGARLTEVDLPDFGDARGRARDPRRDLRDRLERLRARRTRAGYDRIVIYADREHSANLAYLTGFDPRFEEAMLVVGPSDEPAVLVGNECFGVAGAAPLPMRRHLFQDFSLPSQPRDRSRPLSEILPRRASGTARGRRDRLEDVRRPRHDRGARLPRGRAPPHDAVRLGRERRATC